MARGPFYVGFLRGCNSGRRNLLRALGEAGESGRLTGAIPQTFFSNHRALLTERIGYKE